MSQESKSFDVVIAGAGMAGLSVAWHLLVEHEFAGSVALIDARDRVGGRICSAELAGKRVEMGANWIHGIVGNPVYSLAEKLAQFDPLSVATTGDCYNDPTVCAQCTPDARLIPLSLLRSAYEAYFRMVKQCECWPNRASTSGSETKSSSVGSELRRQIDEYVQSRPEEQQPVLLGLFEQMLQRECCINGCADMQQVSLSAYGAYDELPGGNLLLPGGYSQLIDRMLIEIKRKAGAHLKVLLGHELRTVRWSGVCGQSDSSSDVQLQLADGQTISTRHLVNCLPIGVLKSRLSSVESPLYEPPLPDYKMRAVQAIGVDAVEKIWIEYEQSLCPLHWDPMVDELLSVNLPTDQAYELAEHWPRRIYSFARLNNRLLLAWAFGPEARHARSLLEHSPQLLQQQLTTHLRVLTGKRDFPAPRRVEVTNWADDPFTLGSYSFVAVGATPRSYDELAEPIYADPAHQKVRASLL
jgi:monoamine oxidase